jgi:hypothetical protein
MIYIRVVNGRKRNPKQGTIHDPKTASKVPGRAIQAITRKILDKPATKPVKQPELFSFISFSFLDFELPAPEYYIFLPW